MKIPPVLITSFRVCIFLMLLLIALVLWRAMPYWPSSNPPLAVGLPAGWTPAGPDLGLAWSTPLVMEGFGLNSYMGGSWLMVQGKLTCLMIRMPRDGMKGQAQRVAEIEVLDRGEYRVLTFAAPAEPQVAMEIDGKLWVIAHPSMMTGSPYLALQIDPNSGAILATESLAPQEADRDGTIWEQERLDYLAIPDLDGIVITATNSQLKLDAVLWRPGQPIAPIDLISAVLHPRSAKFRRDDGVLLTQGLFESVTVTATSEKIMLTLLGQQVAPSLKTPLFPKGWVLLPSQIPNLQDPPIMLRQTYLIRESLGRWQDHMPKSILRPQDVAQLGTALDVAIRKQLLGEKMAYFQPGSEIPVYLHEPLTLHTPSGSTILTDDTGAAAVESFQHIWDPTLTLYRLNPTQALVAQLLPWEEPGTTGTTPLLRFGLVTTTSTTIQWIGWTRLPALPPDKSPPDVQLNIYANGQDWILAFEALRAEYDQNYTHLLYRFSTMTTTMPCPPGVTVDGTGWLISSR